MAGTSACQFTRGVAERSSLDILVLCGNQPDIALLHNEHTGPSDGVLFVASCNNVTGINNNGGSVVIAVNQINSWLNAP